MIKTIVTMVVTAIAGLIGYLVSDSFRERLAQKQRDKIASEVARGDVVVVQKGGTKAEEDGQKGRC